MSRKQEVIKLGSTNEKMIQEQLEKIIEEGYYIDQVIQVIKSTYIVIVSKEA